MIYNHSIVPLFTTLAVGRVFIGHPFKLEDYQYSETNVMHFLFNLLKIKGLYMSRALLARPQEVLHKWHLVYCVRVMSVSCYQGWSGTPTLVAAK
jgi:hypothetical protein